MSAPLPHAGKVAIVTGASRGIGREIALELARQGADVVLVARSAELLQSATEEIRQLGRRAEVCAFDLRERAAAQQVVDATRRAFGSVDIVVNNAGATKRGDFFALTDD